MSKVCKYHLINLKNCVDYNEYIYSFAPKTKKKRII